LRITAAIRHPRNQPGPFYVVDAECISCGAPEAEAAQLMSHDDKGHCFFVRQPSTEQEVDAAIRAVWTSCCGAVRHGGSDTNILDRFARIGESSRCDEQRAAGPSLSIRNYVRFSFGNFASTGSMETDLKQILELISGSLEGHSGGNGSFFRYGRDDASFLFVRGGQAFRNSIRFTVRHVAGIEWILHISENELALIGFGIGIDKALRRGHLFSNIRWLTEDQVADANAIGDLHPY
jgi:hypothetical protein